MHSLHWPTACLVFVLGCNQRGVTEEGWQQPFAVAGQIDLSEPIPSTARSIAWTLIPLSDDRCGPNRRTVANGGATDQIEFPTSYSVLQPRPVTKKEWVVVAWLSSVSSTVALEVGVQPGDLVGLSETLIVDEPCGATSEGAEYCTSSSFHPVRDVVIDHREDCAGRAGS